MREQGKILGYEIGCADGRTDPNDNIYCTSTSLTGPWSAWKTFATAGSKTYNSQTGAVVNIRGVPM